VFHILLALGDEEQHGYAIMRKVEEITDGAVHMGPGTLYGSIKRMLAEGLIEEVDERPDPELDNERRRYYRVTAAGVQARSMETRRMQVLLNNTSPRLGNV
jgi:DNA-binding PadR family transcriptional regulator